MHILFSFKKDILQRKGGDFSFFISIISRSSLPPSYHFRKFHDLTLKLVKFYDKIILQLSECRKSALWRANG